MADKFRNIEIPENSTGYENRQSYKIDTPKAIKDIKNSNERPSTQINIKGEIDNLKNSEYLHDISHIVAAEFVKENPTILEILTEEFPTIINSKDKLRAFNPSGEFVPEVIDAIYEQGNLANKNILHIASFVFDKNSNYWINRTLKERVTDLKQVGESYNRKEKCSKQEFEVIIKMNSILQDFDKLPEKTENLKNEIARLKNSDQIVESIYDVFYIDQGGFWNILKLQDRVLELALTILKNQSNKSVNCWLIFPNNSFARWSYDTSRTANKTFSNNITTFQAFSSLKD